MNTNPSIAQSNDPVATSHGVMKRFGQVGLGLLLLATSLFLAAGRLDWGMAWAYIGLYVVNVLINALLILPKHPELIAERGATKADAKQWDRLLSLLMTCTTFAMLIVAGLQIRFGWLPPIRLSLQLLALLIVVLGQSLFSWAMAANPFFSRTVRIQLDRGQTVVSGGPYQYVRHPGYTGMILASLTTPIMLGAWWALIPGGLTALLYVVRTAWEDRTLQEELPGYMAYVQHVPYRLCPGVW